MYKGRKVERKRDKWKSGCKRCWKRYLSTGFSKRWGGKKRFQFPLN